MNNILQQHTMLVTKQYYEQLTQDLRAHCEIYRPAVICYHLSIVLACKVTPSWFVSERNPWLKWQTKKAYQFLFLKFKFSHPLLHHHLLRHPSPRRAAAITSTIVAAPPLDIGLLLHHLLPLLLPWLWRSHARGARGDLHHQRHHNRRGAERLEEGDGNDVNAN